MPRRRGRGAPLPNSRRHPSVHFVSPHRSPSRHRRASPESLQFTLNYNEHLTPNESLWRYFVQIVYAAYGVLAWFHSSITAVYSPSQALMLK
jgi:hypothetical protein